MKRLGVLLSVVLTGALGGSVGPSIAVAKEPFQIDRATAVLAIVGGEIERPKLVWLDPRTLERLKRGAVPLGDYAGSSVFSPTGGRLAIGGSGVGIRIVDVFRMKLLAKMARRGAQWEVAPVAWPAERRLLAVEYHQRLPRNALIVVDPVSRRVLRRVAIDRLSTSRIAGGEVVFLAEPSEGIGPARVLVVNGNGAVRSVVLDRIRVGGQQEGPEDDPTYRMASPGLAVDPEGRRAYVVGEGDLVGEVDLGRLDVAYRRLSRPASLLGRLRNWLEPKAGAKAVTGWSRQAVWLGDGAVAVTGREYNRLRSRPSGLQLIDVRAGTVRTLEPRASFAVADDGVLLAGGAEQDGETEVEQGIGVAAFSYAGDELWRRFGDEAVWWVQTAGGYGYLPGPDGYPLTVRVLDLASGAVRTVATEMPYFVIDNR